MGACMFLSLLIHPILDANFFHGMQIINNIFMMHNPVFNVYGNEVLKAPTREIATFMAAYYAFFLCAFPESMTAFYAFCRNPA